MTATVHTTDSWQKTKGPEHGTANSQWYSDSNISYDWQQYWQQSWTWRSQWFRWQKTVHTTDSSYNLQWSWTHSILWQQTVQGSLGICILGHWWSRSQSRGKLVSDATEIGTFIGDIEYAALTHLSARVKASAILHFIALFKFFFSTLASARRTRKWWWLWRVPLAFKNMQIHLNI